jgi:hypothetical protein
MARFFVRQLIQTVKIPDGGSHAEIVVWENVKAAKRKNQKHLRRPNADAFDLSQGFNHGVVAHALHSVQP